MSKKGVFVAMTRLKFPVYDWSDETSNVNWPVVQGLVGGDALNLVTAIEGLIRGTVGEQVLVDDVVLAAGSTARPASPDAQREDKFVITYRDTVNQNVYRYSLPTADRTLLPGGSEVLPATDAAYIAFETQFNASVLSPYGNAVELISIEYVAVSI